MRSLLSTRRLLLTALIAVLLAFPRLSIAQPSYGTGMIMDDASYEAVPQAPTLMRGSYTDLPRQASVKAYAPAVGNQGRTGTCVGWATAYAARTIVAAIEHGWTDRDVITANAYSPSFVYNTLKPRHTPDPQCTFGAYIPHALSLIKDQGAAPLADFPFACNRPITDTDRQVAADHTIIDYLRLFTTNSPNKISPVKKSLAEGKPVVIGMAVTTSFHNVGSKPVWEPAYDGEVADGGGHAMTVVGYDDDRDGGAFEVMNSWGTRWGDGGFVWIPYRHFARYVYYGFEVFAPPPPEPDGVDLAGALSLKLDTGDPMPATFRSGRYVLDQQYPSWTYFEAFLTNEQPAYVYAFGTDLTKKTTRLAPLNGGTSAFLSHAGSSLPLTNEDTYLYIDDRPGTDYLTLLYARTPLDLDALLQEVEQTSGPFMARLHAALGDALVVPKNVHFEPNRIAFRANATQGDVVAVVVEVEHIDEGGPDIHPPQITLLTPAATLNDTGDRATLTLPTGQTTLTLKGTAHDDQQLATLTLRGRPLPVAGDGSFTATPTLRGQGPETLLLEATDASGNRTQFTLALTYHATDTEAPVIAVHEPRVVRGSLRGIGAAQKRQRVVVRGSVEDASEVQSVYVNGIAATLSGGHFEAEVMVPANKQKLRIKAVDAAGNTADDLFQIVPPAQTEQALRASPDFFEDRDDYVVVEVYYGTDRKATGDPTPARFYNGERGTLAYGTARVSIPKGHSVGKLESPVWWQFEFTEDPAEHVVLLSVNPQAPGDALAAMRAAVNRSDEKEAFVYVHGYNNAFEDAARRTAQLTYDLGFEGAPIFYSWPSDDELTRYAADEQDAAWTVPHLEAFIEDVARNTGARKVHLLAHSMGNRPLTTALTRLADRYPAPLFNQIVLAAPDIDADVFRRDIAPHLSRIGERVTLYASSDDKALQLSKQVHGYPRAGDSGGGLIVYEGIDTIDASGIDTDMLGHTYFAQTERILRDMAQLLTEGLEPEARSLIRRAKELLAYWLLSDQ